MVIGAARRLTTGKAVGIDLWSAEDQTANTPEAALDNARIEGVADGEISEGVRCWIVSAKRPPDRRPSAPHRPTPPPP